MDLSKFLPIKNPLSRSSSKGEYYFALNIGNKFVEAAVWGVEGHKLRLINAASTVYHAHEELIEAANYALDEALADFQPEPTKILFGVPDDWLEDDNLKPDHLKFLHKMVKELDVSPMAFVSVTHAVSHLLQKQHGVPTTAILVNVSNPLVVAVIKGGKILGVRHHRRSGDLARDIEKSLMSFTEVEVLPSKIIIFGAEAEHTEGSVKEELLSFPWMAQLPFLHLPKIEELDPGVEIKAISYAGASELIPDITLPAMVVPSHLLASDKGARTMHKFPQEEHARIPGHHPVEEGDNFVAGDITEADAHYPARGRHEVDDEVYAPAEFDQESPTDLVPARRGHQDLQYPEVGGNTLPDKARGILYAPLGLLSSAVSFFPFGGGKKFVILPVIFLAVLIGAFLFLAKARVEVFVDMKTLEKDATVVADPSITAVDEEAKKIPGKIVETTLEDTAKGQATGKKQIGEPARGKVVVYNATGDTLTLAKGTTLANDKGQKFILDSEVQVASKSASAADPPTKSNSVDATASDIGPDGNIPALQDLKVGNFGKAEVVAKVDSAFLGGVSKDVTIVTADDQKRLLTSLTSEMRRKASDELQAKSTGDIKVLAESLAEQITKQSYSKKVGDQAADFNLTVTASYTGTSYSDADLKQIVSKLVETNVPEGYTLDLSKTETQANVSKVEKGGRLIFAAKYKAKLMPKMDLEQIKKEIAGKTADQASDRLKQIENVIGSNIVFSPSLPSPFKRLPFITKNITLEVTTK